MVSVLNFFTDTVSTNADSNVNESQDLSQTAELESPTPQKKFKRRNQALYTNADDE